MLKRILIDAETTYRERIAAGEGSKMSSKGVESQ